MTWVWLVTAPGIDRHMRGVEAIAARTGQHGLAIGIVARRGEQRHREIGARA